MAQAAIECSMTEPAESPTATMILRNNDPLSHALRDGLALEIDDIAHLNRTILPAHSSLSSIGTSSTAVFSSHEDSIVTKPTSIDTSHPTIAHNDKGKGKRKLKTGYASSLSGTDGSASEAEVERKALRRDTLLAVGEWTAAEIEPSRFLRGSVRAKDRQHGCRRPKYKKPNVIIEQHDRVHGPSGELDELIVTTLPSYGSTGKRYLRHGPDKPDVDPIRLTEEGLPLPISSQHAEFKLLSRARLHALFGLSILMVSTVALTAYGAHVTGRTRMLCTRGIVFAGTALLACLIVIAMLIARRALSEALLAGLIELVFGFAFLMELNDFM